MNFEPNEKQNKKMGTYSTFPNLDDDDTSEKLGIHLGEVESQDSECEQSRPHLVKCEPIHCSNSKNILFLTLFLLVSTSLLCYAKSGSWFPDSIPFHLKVLQKDEDTLSDITIKSTDGYKRINSQKPFSTANPVSDLGLYPYIRPPDSSPGSSIFGDLDPQNNSYRNSLPTNEWYENFLLIPNEQEAPSATNQVYTIPYVVDAAGSIPGLRLFSTRVLAFATIVQITFIEKQGLTLGVSPRVDGDDNISNLNSKRYEIFDDNSESEDLNSTSYPFSPLALTIKWVDQCTVASTHCSLQMMSSTIARGMPYGTMHYHFNQTNPESFSTEQILPTITSEIELASRPIVDSQFEMKCSSKDQARSGNELLVKENIMVTFRESDASWLIFYSQPVFVKCYENFGEDAFILQVTRLDEALYPLQKDGGVLTSRVALYNNCTYGTNPAHCVDAKPQNNTDFGIVLKSHAHIYPGPSSNIDFSFSDEEALDGRNQSYLYFNWDARSVKTNNKVDDSESSLLMYALPHHLDVLLPMNDSPNKYFFSGKKLCNPSLNGNTCLVEGSNWMLLEDLGGEPNFLAPRPPKDWAITHLVKAISKDINFRLPEYYIRGAGDTYFSGKMLAKLARILLITEEIKDICSSNNNTDSPSECEDSTLPSEKEFEDAIDRLRANTEIWINGTAVTPFVYDMNWGGIASCGCLFDGETNSCDNTFPDCPSFSDPGLDFGHAFYNDHHFHQGYHIYAAAAVAHFDPKWGREHFEQVLLLIRDIANPSSQDNFFPLYRMKDWYLGNSWASGIARVFSNGKNQESSSESIAAYEAISLFGRTMVDAWKGTHEQSEYVKDMISKSYHISDVGRLLMATELRSAQRYWHVTRSENDQIYPEVYEPFVVGIMWNMLAQFQTWFGNAPYYVYGIQLMPLTAISERRDRLVWAKEMYSSFAESCTKESTCQDQGWSILLNAILATVGHSKKAIQYSESLPSSVFESAGGNGHSLTNTIWYYSTRPHVKDPLILPSFAPTTTPKLHDGKQSSTSCDSCEASVHDNSHLNKCPPTAPYVCTSGNNIGGCSTSPWILGEEGGNNCFSSCSLFCNPAEGNTISSKLPVTSTYTSTNSSQKTTSSIKCGPCGSNICNDPLLNRCPYVSAPYVCTKGRSISGCSATPWILGSIGDGVCDSCCKYSQDCST